MVGLFLCYTVAWERYVLSLFLSCWSRDLKEGGFRIDKHCNE
jgi:hypothetical protein